MKYKILYTKSYTKRASRFIRKHPELTGQYQKTLKLMEANPFHPSLRLHKLRGKFSELYSVSINIGYRITIELIFDKEIIVPVNVGAHSEIYEQENFYSQEGKSVCK